MAHHFKQNRNLINGGLAQLGERLPCKQEVTGSIPVLSTTQKRLIEAIRNCCFTEFLLKKRDSNCTLKTEHCYYECNYEKATVKEKLLKLKGKRYNFVLKTSEIEPA